MRIFGFTINAKREPRFAPYEALTGIYQELEQLKERNTELFKLIEATRVRVYQKSKDNNEGEPVKSAPSQERVISPEALYPGADPEIVFGRYL